MDSDYNIIDFVIFTFSAIVLCFSVCKLFIVTDESKKHEIYYSFLSIVIVFLIFNYLSNIFPIIEIKLNLFFNNFDPKKEINLLYFYGVIISFLLFFSDKKKYEGFHLLILIITYFYFETLNFHILVIFNLFFIAYENKSEKPLYSIFKSLIFYISLFTMVSFVDENTGINSPFIHSIICFFCTTVFLYTYSKENQSIFLSKLLKICLVTVIGISIFQPSSYQNIMLIYLFIYSFFTLLMNNEDKKEFKCVMNIDKILDAYSIRNNMSKLFLYLSYFMLFLFYFCQWVTSNGAIINEDISSIERSIKSVIILIELMHLMSLMSLFMIIMSIIFLLLNLKLIFIFLQKKGFINFINKDYNLFYSCFNIFKVFSNMIILPNLLIFYYYEIFEIKSVYFMILVLYFIFFLIHVILTYKIRLIEFNYFFSKLDIIDIIENNENKQKVIDLEKKLEIYENKIKTKEDAMLFINFYMRINIFDEIKTLKKINTIILFHKIEIEDLEDLNFLFYTYEIDKIKNSNVYLNKYYWEECLNSIKLKYWFKKDIDSVEDIVIFRTLKLNPDILINIIKECNIQVNTLDILKRSSKKLEYDDSIDQVKLNKFINEIRNKRNQLIPEITNINPIETKKENIFGKRLKNNINKLKNIFSIKIN